MSGHSKWSKVKHQKAATDVVKGREFTKASRAITMAVKEGGGITDPNLNFHLRLAIEKARDVNMPKSSIERAIDKASGGSGGALYHVEYECFGPYGIALLVQATTDNKIRTVSELKHVLERGGGSLASPGSVGYLFEKRGVVVVPKGSVLYDTLLVYAIEAGADDVTERDDMFEIYTKPHDLHAVSQKLKEQSVPIDNTERIMHPKAIVAIDETVREAIDRLVASIETLDDIDHVYTNTE